MEKQQVTKNELKPKQWFMDRIGKTVIRQSHPSRRYTGPITVFIIDELQAQYMFDVQNDLYNESGICLNYRDYEEKQ